MKFERKNTIEDREVYDSMDFKTTDSEIRNPDGSIVRGRSRSKGLFALNIQEYRFRGSTGILIPAIFDVEAALGPVALTNFSPLIVSPEASFILIIWSSDLFLVSVYGHL